jgi:hypothetical protein
MGVRIFTVRGAPQGNVRQLLHDGDFLYALMPSLMTPRDPDPTETSPVSRQSEGGGAAIPMTAPGPLV